MEHHIVAAAEGRFSGWPANNGAFPFGADEILIGFTECEHVVTASGHNVAGPTEDDPQPFKSLLARSLNGGDSWRVEKPGGNFVGSCEDAAAGPAVFPGGVDFSTEPGFALRMVGTGYHGNTMPKGAFFITLDRGASWSGPYSLGTLLQHPELEGMEITTRTCYHLESSGSLAVLLSARPIKGQGLGIDSDKTFLARTNDCVEWTFAGWLIPRTDPYRAVMPSMAVLAEGHWVVALRRRDMGNPSRDCWIDAVTTRDAGRTWTEPETVASTGLMNGNPPALVATLNGMLCCVYGERNTRRILARYKDVSADNPLSAWSAPAVLRDDYFTSDGMADLGYPRVIRRESDGKLVAMYYWADAATPRQHIAATIWTPPKPSSSLAA